MRQFTDCVVWEGEAAGQLCRVYISYAFETPEVEVTLPNNASKPSVGMALAAVKACLVDLCKTGRTA